MTQISVSDPLVLEGWNAAHEIHVRASDGALGVLQNRIDAGITLTVVASDLSTVLATYEIPTSYVMGSSAVGAWWFDANVVWLIVNYPTMRVLGVQLNDLSIYDQWVFPDQTFPCEGGAALKLTSGSMWFCWRQGTAAYPTRTKLHGIFRSSGGTWSSMTTYLSPTGADVYKCMSVNALQDPTSGNLIVVATDDSNDYTWAWRLNSTTGALIVSGYQVGLSPRHWINPGPELDSVAQCAEYNYYPLVAWRGDVAVQIANYNGDFYDCDPYLWQPAPPWPPWPHLPPVPAGRLAAWRVTGNPWTSWPGSSRVALLWEATKPYPSGTIPMSIPRGSHWRLGFMVDDPVMFSVYPAFDVAGHRLQADVDPIQDDDLYYSFWDTLYIGAMRYTGSAWEEITPVSLGPRGSQWGYGGFAGIVSCHTMPVFGINRLEGDGTHTLSLYRASITSGAMLAASAGSYAVSGTTITEHVSMPAAASAYGLNGAAITPRVKTPAGAGAYALSGLAITPRVSSPAGAGEYVVTGAALTLRVRTTVLAGSYGLTGAEVTLTKGGVHLWELAAAGGQYVLAGQAVALTGRQTWTTSASPVLVVQASASRVRTGRAYAAPMRRET